MSKKAKPIKVRNLHALNAILRRAQRYKHKTTPKDGSNNWHRLGDTDER